MQAAQDGLSLTSVDHDNLILFCHPLLQLGMVPGAAREYEQKPPDRELLEKGFHILKQEHSSGCPCLTPTPACLEHL